MSTDHKRWRLSEMDLRELDPVKARELIIKCFFESQKETFARAKQNLGKEARDDEIRKTVESVIRLSFKEVGGSYEEPTKEDLGKVVSTLARKADSWGTPPDIIEHHKGQIIKILNLLK